MAGYVSIFDSIIYLHHFGRFKKFFHGLNRWKVYLQLCCAFFLLRDFSIFFKKKCIFFGFNSFSLIFFAFDRMSSVATPPDLGIEASYWYYFLDKLNPFLTSNLTKISFYDESRVKFENRVSNFSV